MPGVHHQMANTGHQVVEQRRQQCSDDQLGQRTAQVGSHLVEAFWRRQRRIEREQHERDTDEQDDTGYTVENRRVSSDWEFYCPKI